MILAPRRCPTTDVYMIYDVNATMQGIFASPSHPHIVTRTGRPYFSSSLSHLLLFVCILRCLLFSSASVFLLLCLPSHFRSNLFSHCSSLFIRSFLHYISRSSTFLLPTSSTAQGSIFHLSHNHSYSVLNFTMYEELSPPMF